MIGMPKGVRIFDLAKELNMSSVDLSRLFEALGLRPHTQSSIVKPHIADQLRTQLAHPTRVFPSGSETAGERLTREHQERRAEPG